MPRSEKNRLWKKGESGNPGGRVGRPKGVERYFRAWLQEADGDKTKLERMWERLYEIARFGEEKNAIAAIKFAIERAHGLPKAHLEVSASLTDEQRMEELRDIAREVLTREAGLEQVIDAEPEHVIDVPMLPGPAVKP